jgi:hypothetical protein
MRAEVWAFIDYEAIGVRVPDTISGLAEGVDDDRAHDGGGLIPDVGKIDNERDAVREEFTEVDGRGRLTEGEAQRERSGQDVHLVEGRGGLVILLPLVEHIGRLNPRPRVGNSSAGELSGDSA